MHSIGVRPVRSIVLNTTASCTLPVPLMAETVIPALPGAELDHPSLALSISPDVNGSTFKPLVFFLSRAGVTSLSNGF